MNKAQALHDLGQSLWLDYISREMLDNGTLRRYIDEYAITGLTSNPTIFDEAIGKTSAYDEAIRAKAGAGQRGEALFIELALEDLRRAADLFRPAFDATERRRRLGVDGGLAAARLRYVGQRRGGRAHPPAGRAAQSLRQDPGHAGRRPRDRGIDLRGGSDQRDAALLARAIRRGSRSLPARHRAAHRRQARSARRFGRLALREPVGQGGRREGPARAAQPAGHRDRRPHLPRVSRAPRFAALAQARRGRARVRSGCSGRAPGPRIRTRRTRSTSKRWRRPTPSTRCPRRRCTRSPSTERSTA